MSRHQFAIHDYVMEIYLQNERIAKTVRQYLFTQKALKAEQERKSLKIKPKTIKPL